MSLPNLTPPPALRPELGGGAVVRLGLAYAAATNGLVITPFLVAAMMLRFHLGEGAATQIAGVEILGIAISCALLPRWISRAARSFSVAGVVGVIAGQAMSVFSWSVALMSAARGLTGIFEGVLFVVVASSASYRESADRLWGKINLLSGGINGSILVLVSCLPDAWMGRWIFILLLGAVSAMAPVTLGVGQFAKHSTRTHAQHRKTPYKLVLTIWTVSVLIYGVQSAQWAVAGIVGVRSGLSAATIGVLLSVSSLLGFAGAVIPAQRATHAHRLKLIFLSQLVMIGAIVGFFHSTGNWSYFLSQLALNCAFFVIVPYLGGLLSEIDSDGSLVARTLVVTFVAAGTCTAFTGSLFEQYGSTRFAYGLCIGVLAALPFVWLALRGVGERDVDSTTPTFLATANTRQGGEKS